MLKHVLYFFVTVALLTSCSTKKNTVVSRAYHDITARYNGYYYSCVNIDDGIFKIEQNNKDNFEKLLPIYVYPSMENAKTTFPEFDKAIKKSSFCIQRHTIKDKKGNEAPHAGKWIDNNWINIGISQFYKREFFSAIESFEYVTRTYTKSQDKYLAMLWLIKAYNEIGSVSNSEPLIALLKNEKGLSREVKKEIPVATADYYMRRGQNTEASTRLMEAARNSDLIFGINHKKRARYAFIAAQLFEQLKNNKRAIEYYKKTIALKPKYEMIFYSKIKMARLLDVKRNNSDKTKKDLIKMAREFKNSDYYDVIYYTLGEIEEKESNQTHALYYFKRSVQTSVNNPNQKALSFLKLGEINFDRSNYTPAEAYYDSAVATLSKDHPEYKSIVARKKTLETLVGYMRTITKEDSLQRIAKMSDAEINAFIDKLIADREMEEERKMKALEAAKNANNGQGSAGVPTPEVSTLGQVASFYFYSPTVVAFGIADFQKRWGNRKLEDNWRRANRALTIENPVENDSAVANNSAAAKNKNPSVNREVYKKNLPFGDSLIAKSNSRIIKAYYMLGSIYKEELNNTKKTIASFEELNSRFPSNKYLLSTYYTLYRIYQDAKNQPKSDYYRDKILNEFPDSEFALLIKNPNLAEEMNSQKSEVEIFYNDVYNAFHDNNFSKSLSSAREGIKKFGNNPYKPKFELIKSMSLGKIKGLDSMEFSLRLLVANFPTSEVTPLANDILLSIKKQKEPKQAVVTETVAVPVIKPDTFNVDFEVPHFIIGVLQDDPKIVEAFKTNLNVFYTKYYSNKTFELTSSLFGLTRQLVILKTFDNAKEAILFYDNLMKDKDVFTGIVKKDNIDVVPISKDNLQFFYKKKNVTDYKVYYKNAYKKLK